MLSHIVGALVKCAAPFDDALERLCVIEQHSVLGHLGVVGVGGEELQGLSRRHELQVTRYRGSIVNDLTRRIVFRKEPALVSRNGLSEVSIRECARRVPFGIESRDVIPVARPVR